MRSHLVIIYTFGIFHVKSSGNIFCLESLSALNTYLKAIKIIFYRTELMINT